MSASEPSTDLPWRKRHPVLSRALLFGLGAGIAVMLVVLLTNRREDDERVRREALRKELDSLAIVFATDPDGDRVLTLLDEKFSASDLPSVTQGRALRWRALVWRRKARNASEEGPRSAAFTRAEAAFQACSALEFEPSERYALHLEWAEARLEADQAKGALQVLPSAEAPAGVPARLLRALMLARARRLEGDEEQAVRVVQDTLLAFHAELGGPAQLFSGGRDWTAAQVAIQLADFLARVDDGPRAESVWTTLGRSLRGDFQVQVATARGLAALGREENALTFWRRARAINRDLAAAEARREPLLQALDERLDGR